MIEVDQSRRTTGSIEPVTLTSLAPPPDLVGAVRFLYRVRAVAGSEALFNHPQGAVDLLFLLSGALRFDKGPGTPALASAATVLVPLQTSFFRFSFDVDTHVLGVAFQPHGCRELIDVPAGELVDACVDLEAAGHPGLSRLRGELCELGAGRDLACLIAWLRRRRARRVMRVRLGEVWARLPGLAGSITSISELARELEMSPRTLQRLFRSELGITPKAALRIARFQNVLKSLRGPRQPRWSDLALQHGYFDQAHFCNDFRALTGFSPTALLKEQRPLAEVFDRAREMSGELSTQ